MKLINDNPIACPCEPAHGFTEPKPLNTSDSLI